eukprot:3255502-Amphidinium_carterae.1
MFVFFAAGMSTLWKLLSLTDEGLISGLLLKLNFALGAILSRVTFAGSTGRSKCVTATNRMAWDEVQMHPSLFRDLGVVIDPRKDRFRQDHGQGWWGAAFFGEVDVALVMHMGS